MGVPAFLEPDPNFDGIGHPIVLARAYEGIVRDATSGMPLEGVVILPWQTYNPSTGRYTMLPLDEVRSGANGDYTLRFVGPAAFAFWKDGYRFKLYHSSDLRADSEGTSSQMKDVLLEPLDPREPSN
jgi:hypothetical protein